MNIKITVRNKLPICGDVAIVCNNSDYTVIWELDEEWSTYDTKTMRTAYKDGTYTDTVFTGNTVALPVVTVPGRVKIGLYAGDIRTSRPALIRALPSITTDGGAPADPPEDVYNQIMELIKKMETVSPEDIAKAVEDYLTEHPAAAASMRVEGGYIQFSADGKTWEDVIALADLKGAPGKDGAPGDDGITPHIGDNGNWYLGDEDTGKPSHGEKGDTGDTGPQGPAGAGMNVTGATVGQIAKITAVDENGKPTAWEAVDMPSGEGETWELLKDITTEEAVAALNFDLGKECSEVCVFISGKWVTGLTSPYVVINMCSNDSYSEIGQKNVVYETASFYANNVRTVIADCSMLSPGFWKVVAADNVAPSPPKITSYNAKFGSNSVGTFPNRCRYLHIGTHDSTHQYEAGLVVKIWGK